MFRISRGSGVRLAKESQNPERQGHVPKRGSVHQPMGGRHPRARPLQEPELMLFKAVFCHYLFARQGPTWSRT